MVTFAEQTLAVHHSRPAKATPAGRTNVNRVERWASVVGGAALATYGARRRGLPGTALALIGGVLLERGVTGHCPVYGALGVTTNANGDSVIAKRHGPAAILEASRAVRVERAVTIARPAETLYAFWRQFENLPRVMTQLEDVTALSPMRSRWRAKGPAGQHVEWEAEIVNEIPNRLIAWKSVDEASVPNAGSVHFTPAPGGRGTEVRVVLEYEPPAGRLGAAVARLVHDDPDTRVHEDLRRFKQMMEAGEVPTVDGQPACR